MLENCFVENFIFSPKNTRVLRLFYGCLLFFVLFYYYHFNCFALNEDHERVFGTRAAGSGCLLGVVRAPEPLAVAFNVNQRSPARDSSGYAMSAATSSEILASGRVFASYTDYVA